MATTHMVDLKSLGDERGALVSLESNINVPFSIKRVYYIFNTMTDVVRGKHAHRNLKQLAICVSGSCRFVLDDGFSQTSFLLDQPDKALYIEDLTWREMHDFSDDCVLLVLASELYDESDYIRDYAQFLQEVNKNV